MISGHSQHKAVRRRGLSDDEVLAVNALVARCNQYEGLNLTLYLEHAHDHPGHEANQILYYDDGELVGILTLQPGDPIEVSLAVHPDHRRQGIGRALLDAARAECVGRGLSQWYLVCERVSQSGRGFVNAVGGRYHYSEYRMKFEHTGERLVPSQLGSIHLHQADATEVEVLARLIATSFGRTEERVRQRVLRELQKPTHRYFIATLQGQPVGSLGVAQPGQHPYIIGFGVLPEHRGRGYGRQMLEGIVRTLVAEGTERILIEVATDNEQALSLYRSCGFEEMTSYGYYLAELSPVTQ